MRMQPCGSKPAARTSRPPSSSASNSCSREYAFSSHWMPTRRSQGATVRPAGEAMETAASAFWLSSILMRSTACPRIT